MLMFTFILECHKIPFLNSSPVFVEGIAQCNNLCNFEPHENKFPLSESWGGNFVKTLLI